MRAGTARKIARKSHVFVPDSSTAAASAIATATLRPHQEKRKNEEERNLNSSEDKYKCLAEQDSTTDF